MSAHVICLLNGMGQHGPDWSTPVTTTLAKTLTTIGSPLDLANPQDVEVVELTYGEAFDEWVNQRDLHGAQLSAAVPASRLGDDGYMYGI